jgi:hypothetical protein
MSLSSDSAFEPTPYQASKRRLVVTGVTLFAGVVLMMLGCMHILEGIVGIANESLYKQHVSYAYDLNSTTWGIVNIVIGAIAVAVGLGIVVGQQWARLAGVGVALLSALAGFAFLPYKDTWGLVTIAFAFVVLWALMTQMRHEGAL